MTERQKIDQEVKRIAASPQSGYFTFVHHNNQVDESENIMERIEYILRDKPKEEILTRLSHIHWISQAVYDDYLAKFQLLGDDYEAKRKPLEDDYRAKRKLLGDDYRAKRKLLGDDYRAKLKLLGDDYRAKRKLLGDDYEAKLKLLEDDLLVIIPDCKWDGQTIL